VRVLFITDNFVPELNAPATRTYEHCRQWVEAGVDVTVVTCAPNFPDGIVYAGYRNQLYKRETIDGIKVIRVWSFIARNAGFVRRILDYVSFAISAFVAGLFQRFDVVIITSPQFFTTFSGFGLSVLKWRPWVFEVRDLWPESIVAVGAMKAGRLIDWLERVELFMYRRASLVVVVTEAFRRNLIRRGIDTQKIRVVPNGANLRDFAPREKDPQLLAQYGLSDKFVFMYVGTHGMAHGLEFIIEALAKLQMPNVAFLFIGSGSNKEAVTALAKRLGVAQALFLDPVPKSEVPRYLSLADVALVPLRRLEAFLSVIPSKIFEAAAMHKPILLGVGGQAREVVEKYSAGLYFEPENATDFLEKVTTLVEDAAAYQRLQNGCAALVADYDRQVLGRVLLEEMLELSHGR
jgi:glycosyltransferase involved in cell wall biosynthesis